MRAAESFPWFCLWHGEGQENSWEPLQSPTDPRCSHRVRSLPVPFLLQCLSTSLPSGRVEKKNWQRCVPVVKLVVFVANCLLALSHALSQMWPIWSGDGKASSNHLGELQELKMDILVFLKLFPSLCNVTVLRILIDQHFKQHYIHKQINRCCLTESSCFYGEADVVMQGQIRHL